MTYYHIINVFTLTITNIFMLNTVIVNPWPISSHLISHKTDSYYVNIDSTR